MGHILFIGEAIGITQREQHKVIVIAYKAKCHKTNGQAKADEEEEAHSNKKSRNSSQTPKNAKIVSK